MTQISSTSTAPSCQVDLYAEETIANPPKAYAEMHAVGPVVWLEKNDIHAIVGYTEITKALRNHQCFQSGKGVSINESVNKLLVGSSLNSDPPAHDDTRSITSAPLTMKAVQKIRDKVEKEAVGITEQCIKRGQVDAASELAPYLPLTIVRDLVGLGDYGKDSMLGWGASTFELMGDPRERKDDAIEQLKRMREFLEDPQTLNNLSEQGWAKRATRIGIDSGMTPERAAELMRDYIAPSLDTTISAIGYGILMFAKHPEAWTRIRADRSLLKNTIEEIVRLNTPIRAFTRYVADDVELAGIRFEKGQRVMMVFGAANRDPVRFADPDAFDIDRDVRGHVGFGFGVHNCLGMHLARLEMQCLFNALADHVKYFHLDGPVVAGVNSTIHSFASIPVRFET